MGRVACCPLLRRVLAPLLGQRDNFVLSLAQGKPTKQGLMQQTACYVDFSSNKVFRGDLIRFPIRSRQKLGISKGFAFWRVAHYGVMRTAHNPETLLRSVSHRYSDLPNNGE